MPADLLESNLFGHVKGAFTGAIANKKGLFELANGGSIFFDEIGNIPLDTQSKLLRVIQEKEFMRLGGVETLKADVRIIAATNADLEAQVAAAARFREDLYYRLNVITITPAAAAQAHRGHPAARPALPRALRAREREGDRARSRRGAMELLLDYHWPGNVRELENVIERAVVLSTGEVLDVDLLPHVGAPAATERRLPPATLPANGISLKDAVVRLRAPAHRQGAAGLAAACRSAPPSCSRSSRPRSTR